MFDALHVPLFAHVPQLVTVRAWPQLSVPLFWPHSAPRRAQNCASVSVVHPHTFAAGCAPPPQVSPVPAQMPQLETVRF